MSTGRATSTRTDVPAVGSVVPLGAVPLPTDRYRVLQAVCAQRRPTIRSVSDATGVAWGSVRSHLEKLAEAGLVAWEPGRAGTLHPCVRIVPVSSGGGR
jgi:DNA-binding MarR family transcriptional regulator